jgi:pSer/pThr/pTyr-binding forkhead associated (FHA) protein
MRLVFASGPLEGSTVEVDGERLTVGRIAANDLQLAHETVSRHHAVIEVHGDARVVLRDLGSRNGTFVDGQRISQARTLRGGERLRFGDEQLLVQLGVPARSETGADTQVAAAPPLRRLGERPAGSPAARRLAALRRPRWLALLALAVAALVVFGVGQLVLPGVAEQQLRSQLARNGVVRLVHIESVPAVKLLWHRADSVHVTMDSYRSNPSGTHGSLADFLSRTRDTAKLDVSVATLRSKLVTLHNVRLHKSGHELIGQAELMQADLSAALPSFLNLHPVSASAQGIVVAVSASLLGHAVRIELDVLASGGRVIVRPEGLPLASLATITVFSDPRIYVESLEAQLHGERYLLTARARLR